MTETLERDSALRTPANGSFRDALFWQPAKPRWACPEHIMAKWAGPSNAG